MYAAGKGWAALAAVVALVAVSTPNASAEDQSWTHVQQIGFAETCSEGWGEYRVCGHETQDGLWAGYPVDMTYDTAPQGHRLVQFTAEFLNYATVPVHVTCQLAGDSVSVEVPSNRGDVLADPWRRITIEGSFSATEQAFPAASCRTAASDRYGGGEVLIDNAWFRSVEQDEPSVEPDPDPEPDPEPEPSNEPDPEPTEPSCG